MARTKTTVVSPRTQQMMLRRRSETQQRYSAALRELQASRKHAFVTFISDRDQERKRIEDGVLRALGLSMVLSEEPLGGEGLRSQTGKST
jgi:hypothetical protein